MKFAGLAVLFLLINLKKVTSSNFTLYRVYSLDEGFVKRLTTFANFCQAVFSDNEWNAMQVLVPQNFEKLFGDFLMCQGVSFEVELNGSISADKFLNIGQENLEEGNITFDRHHHLHVIESYLQSLQRKYPDLVSLENYGKSSEGRNLTAVKVSRGGGGSKPLIYIDAGIHGNEWLGISQALYILQQLVENPDYRYLIANVDWVVFPVVNPDGYRFSFSKKIAFRKTRSKGVNCIGVDINRNFNFFWNLAFKGGQNECSSVYRGPSPFSEPETRAIRDLVLKHSGRMKLYVSLHASSQEVLYPWGYTKQPPSNAQELRTLGQQAALAIHKVSGTSYGVGQVSEMLYLAAGDSLSWAKYFGSVDLTYVIELPPKNKRSKIPLECIKLVILEVFEGIKIFHRYVENKYGTA